MHYLSLLTTTADTGIDTVVIEAILNVMESILAMFKIFPLNVCMAAFVIGIVIGVFRKLKRA